MNQSTGYLHLINDILMSSFDRLHLPAQFISETQHPMEKPRLRTLKKKMMTYPEYISNDKNSIEQISVLINLHEMHASFYKHGIVDSSYSEPNTFLTTHYTIDWAFECFRMKRAILAKRRHTFNRNLVPCLTQQANQVLLLAMVYGSKEIVEFFLTNRLINVNQSIFGPVCWPSYFVLACSCSEEILSLFKSHKVKYNIGWNGLTPNIISGYKAFVLEKTSYMDFISYQQYALLLKYRNIKLANSFEALPLFVLDFACMNKNRNQIKDILEAIPEAGVLSRLSFIVQSEENLFLILSRFDFRNDQHFNGNTPLHYSCHNGDLCALSLLLYLGFPIVQNYEGKFPNEIGSPKTREKTSVFFNLCTTEVSTSSKRPKRVFLHSAFQDRMQQLMEILKFNPKDYDKYVGIFRYLKFNRNNKIVTNSRFNIINLITMSKTPVSVEQSIKRMIQHPFYERVYSDSLAVSMYYRIFRN